jgi:hypothetical protein
MVSKLFLRDHLRREYRTGVVSGQSHIRKDLKPTYQSVKTEQSWHLNSQTPQYSSLHSTGYFWIWRLAQICKDPRQINITRQQDQFLVSRYNRTSQIRQPNNWLTKYSTFSSFKMPQNEATIWDELGLQQWVEPLRQRRKSWLQKWRSFGQWRAPQGCIPSLLNSLFTFFKAILILTEILDLIKPPAQDGHQSQGRQ